jgi:ribosomal protein S12 methylthiotransferase accessory factor
MAFVDQIYATNGCCAGNTRDEAWVHALSEMMERHASIKMLLSGKAAPKFPEKVLRKYATVSKILDNIRQNGDFDIDIFDCSEEYGYPVVSTRIINKKNHCYYVNIGADPVLEIALQRTLTEIFQGKSIRNFTSKNNGRILNKVSDCPSSMNVMNQFESGSGIFSADYFANELTCTTQPKEFPDNSKKTNKELLEYAMGIYKTLKKPVYVRNFSFLGFPCYRFVVPGFSEALAFRLSEIFPEFVIADEACKVMKNPKAASDEDLSTLLIYSKMISGVYSRYYRFGRISGVPIKGSAGNLLACVTRAYCAYRLGQYDDAIRFANPLMSYEDMQVQNYFSLVNRYLSFLQDGLDEEKIRCILRKFYDSDSCQRLFAALDQGRTPYDDFLLKCDFRSCGDCRYSGCCCYHANKEMNLRVGAVYQTFTHGQDESGFSL